MSSNPFIPNYTQISNVLLDDIAVLGVKTFLVAVVISRETFGWDRNPHVPFDYLVKTIGLPESVIRSGVKHAIEIGIINEIAHDIYELIVDDESGGNT